LATGVKVANSSSHENQTERRLRDINPDFVALRARKFVEHLYEQKASEFLNACEALRASLRKRRPPSEDAAQARRDKPALLTNMWKPVTFVIRHITYESEPNAVSARVQPNWRAAPKTASEIARMAEELSRFAVGQQVSYQEVCSRGYDPQIRSAWTGIVKKVKKDGVLVQKRRERHPVLIRYPRTKFLKICVPEEVR
jgi:hypothetical protein